MRADTDWFQAAKWGLFVHYLADTASNADPNLAVTPAAWNERIDGVDVEGLARQILDSGAGWFYLTLGQNSGYYLSPNATYDALVGYPESHCSRRDLVAELADRLVPHGVRMMVYFTAAAPALDWQAIERLRCTPPWDARKLGFHPELYTPQPGVDARLSEFQTHWEAVVREWSERWGKRVSGWWIDGCYCADEMYRHPDAPNFHSFAAALKAGNPDGIVAFNPGVKVPVICHTDAEDYTAGEVADAFPVAMSAGWREPLGRFVDGAQYHLLTFLGEMWGRGEPRFPDELVIGYTKHVNRFGGVISWDLPTGRDGLIPAAYMAQLRALRQATREGSTVG